MQRSQLRNTWYEMTRDGIPPKDHNPLTIELEHTKRGQILREDVKSLLVKMMNNLKEDPNKQMNSSQDLMRKSAT